MQPFPETLMEAGLVVAGAVGLLILIAPNFGQKPRATAEGWLFPVKPTCVLLYALSLAGGIAAVAYSGLQLLAKGTAIWPGWVGFGFGFLLVPLVLADWPEPLILDAHGLVEKGCAATRIRWQEMRSIRAYRNRCDRGVVLQASGGKQFVVADIAYDTEAVINCLLEWRPVPYQSLHDEMDALSILSDHQTHP